ncbi:sugar transferase [Gemmatimonadota bacterium]
MSADISALSEKSKELASVPLSPLARRRPTWYQKAWGVGFFLILMASDGVVLNLCVILSLQSIYSTPLFETITSTAGLKILILANTVALSSYILNGIYRQARQCSLVRQRAQRRKALLWGAMFFMFGAVMFGHPAFPRMFYFVFFAFYLPAQFLSSFLVVSLNRRLMHRGWGVNRTLIVGTGESAATIYQRLISKPQLGYLVLGFITNDKEKSNNEQNGIELISLGTLEEIERVIDTYHIDTVVVATTDLIPDRYQALKVICERRRLNLRMVSPRADNILQLNHIRDLTGVPLVSRKGWYRRHVYRILKRSIDIVVSALGLILLTPFFILIAAGIKLSSSGPVFFVQSRRLSETDTTIPFIKFRTMVSNADDLKYKILMENNEADGILFKIKDDPRIFPFGAWLRRYSLDELPQLINVFLGQMSLVGPRPLPSKDYLMLNDDSNNAYPFLDIRSQAKPGITGLWQISGRSNLSFSDMVLLDLYYIESCSIMFDFEILLETIPAVIFSRGAY